MWTLLRESSLRHLVATPLRSLLVVIGISLGVAIYVASEATSDSLLASFAELVERMAGRSDLVVSGPESGIDSGLVATVAEVPGVGHAAAALEITSQLSDGSGSLLVLGVDFLGDTHFLPFFAEGEQSSVVEDPLAFANDPTAILVTRTLAKQRGLEKDSTLSLLTAEGPKDFTVWGVLDDEGPVSSFGGRVVVMFLDAAQVTFARGHLIDRVDVALAPGADAAAVKAAIAASIGDAADVQSPDSHGQRLQSLIAPLRNGLRLSGIVALLVAMFIIYNAIGVSVAQRRREVGVLRALGVLRGSIVKYFCAEAVLLAIPGAALGLLLSRFLVEATHASSLQAIQQVYVATPAAPTVGLQHAAGGVATGVLGAAVAALLPARRGARMDPVAALRASSGRSTADTLPHRRMALGGGALCMLSLATPALHPSYGGMVATLLNYTGAALLAPALVLGLRRLLRGGVDRVLGPSAGLGLDHVERDIGRSTINVLALMVAVSMSVSVGGWLGSFEAAVITWFEQVSAAELTVTAGSPLIDRKHMPFAGETPGLLRDVPGVVGIQPVRVTEQRVQGGGAHVTLNASDTRVFLEQAARKGRRWRVLQGPERIAADALSSAPRIVLAENAGNRLGLHPGDSLTLRTPSGPRSFEVYAIVVDYSSEQGAGFIDERYYHDAWQDNAVDAINVYLEDGADPDTVGEALRDRLGNRAGLFVTRTTELREQFLGLVKQSFSYVTSLELIVLLIALLGVIGTLVAAVLDRTRELGMLRAIGASRGQLAASLVVEAAFLGLCAAIGGMLLGVLQTWLFLDTIAVMQSGWRLEFIFPLEASLRIAGLVVMTAGLAGLLPGIRASRLEIRDAIAYE